MPGWSGASSRRVPLPGMKRGWENNHHHLVCRSCGAISDVDCVAGEAPCLTPAEERGFTIDEAEVIYWGLCPTCSIHVLDD